MSGIDNSDNCDIDQKVFAKTTGKGVLNSDRCDKCSGVSLVVGLKFWNISETGKDDLAELALGQQNEIGAGAEKLLKQDKRHWQDSRVFDGRS